MQNEPEPVTLWVAQNDSAAGPPGRSVRLFDAPPHRTGNLPGEMRYLGRWIAALPESEARRLGVEPGQCKPVHLVLAEGE